MCCGDPAVLHLEVHSLHMLQKFIEDVDVRVGQFIGLVLGWAACQCPPPPPVTTWVSSPAQPRLTHPAQPTARSRAGSLALWPQAWLIHTYTPRPAPLSCPRNLQGTLSIIVGGIWREVGVGSLALGPAHPYSLHQGQLTALF